MLPYNYTDSFGARIYGVTEITKDLVSYGTWDKGQVPDDIMVDKLIKNTPDLGLPVRYHIIYKPATPGSFEEFSAIKGWFKKKE